jgi:hypothetical protein
MCFCGCLLTSLGINMLGQLISAGARLFVYSNHNARGRHQLQVFACSVIDTAVAIRKERARRPFVVDSYVVWLYANICTFTCQMIIQINCI